MHRKQHKPSQSALLLLVAARSVPSVLIVLSKVTCTRSTNMQSSVESSGYFENFSSDLDDYDLEEDDFVSSNLSFNGRLVISGEPSVWPVLGTGGNYWLTYGLSLY